MRRTRTVFVGLVVSALGALALAGCSSGSGSEDDAVSSSPTTAESAPPSGTAMTADLSTADSSLGTIVVDGKGMTAYYFLKDVKDSGTSACVDQCAAAWPAIVSESDTPSVDGVTAEVGTIPTADGRKQITVDGRPVYTYAQDMAPGDVLGQGVNDVWYVLAPDGSEVDDD
ncbi:COG4315 family predicted lipoprotein [Cellulomonas sp. URHB0016]